MVTECYLTLWCLRAIQVDSPPSSAPYIYRGQTLVPPSLLTPNVLCGTKT